MDFKIKISTILFAAFTALAVALPAESFGQDGRGLMPGVEGDEREEDEHDGLVKEVGLCDLGPDGEWVVPERGGFGPLDLWSNSPFQSLRLGIIPRPPSILNRGKYQVRFSSTYVNVWAIEENAYFLDYDNVRSTLSFSYSVMDDLQMEMGFSDIHAFGGDMDSFIEGFHDIFGIDQDSRDEYPQNDFRVEILDDFGNGLVDLKDFREVRRQSVHAIIQKDLNGCATRLPIFSLALIGRWHFSQPEGTPDFGYADAGLSLSMATRYRGIYYYVAVSYARLGLEKTGLLRLNKHQVTGLLAIEAPISMEFSLIVQYLVAQGIARDVFPFDKASHELTFGFKWEFDSGFIFEFGLIENLFIYDNSPDFGVHAGVVWSF